MEAVLAAVLRGVADFDGLDPAFVLALPADFDDDFLAAVGAVFAEADVFLDARFFAGLATGAALAGSSTGLRVTMPASTVTEGFRGTQALWNCSTMSRKTWL